MIPPARVALVYTKLPHPAALTAIEKLQRNGATVTVIGPQLRGYERVAGLAGGGMVRVHHRPQPVYVDPARRPKRWTVAWAWIVIRNLWRRASSKPAQKILGAPALWWRSISRDRTAMQCLCEADVITALDQDAVYPVWRAARRNRSAAAIEGVAPTLEHLGLAD